MTEQRKLVVDQIYGYILNLEREYRQKKHEDPQRCRQQPCDHGETCDIFQLGHLVQTIHQHGFDQESSEARNRSLKALSNELQPIVQLYYATPYDSYASRAQHTKCSWLPDFKEFVKTAVGGVKGLRFSDFPSGAGKPSYKLPVDYGGP